MLIRLSFCQKRMLYPYSATADDGIQKLEALVYRVSLEGSVEACRQGGHLLRKVGLMKS